MADWHVVLACISSAATVPSSIRSVRAVEMLLAGHVAIGVTSESRHHLPAHGTAGAVCDLQTNQTQVSPAPNGPRKAVRSGAECVVPVE